MKKKLTALSLVFTLILLTFSGCGKNDVFLDIGGQSITEGLFSYYLDTVVSYPERYGIDAENADEAIEAAVICCKQYVAAESFLKENQLQGLLDSVYNNLEENGYFIFDLFTYNKMKFFNNTTIKDKLAFSKYKWKMKVKNKVLTHTITITDNNEKIVETYEEYYHDYEKLLDKRFKLIKVVTDFKDELDLKKGERILVVLQK